MGKANLSREEAPQTPVRSFIFQSEQDTVFSTSFLSPTTPLSSSDEDADGIFSPPGSVHTEATDDSRWDTPTKKRPGQSNRLFSISLCSSSLDLLKTESLPRASPGPASPTNSPDYLSTCRAHSSEEWSQRIQNLHLKTENVPESISALKTAAPFHHRPVRDPVGEPRSTRGRSASLGHIDSYASQVKGTNSTKHLRSQSLDRWENISQKGFNKLAASCGLSSTTTVPNIEVSPPNNAHNVITVEKPSMLSSLARPTAKSTGQFLFKFDLSDITFVTQPPYDGTKTNPLEAKERRRTINSISTQTKQLCEESCSLNARDSTLSAVPGGLRLSSAELDNHSTSGTAKAPDDSSLKVAGHFRRHSMNLKPDIDFLRYGESHHRRRRSSTRVDTLLSGEHIRLVSDDSTEEFLRAAAPLNINPFAHADIPQDAPLDQEKSAEKTKRAHGISPIVGASIKGENDQHVPQILTGERDTDRKYAHQTLIPYCPKRHMRKPISKVLEEIIVAPLSKTEIQRQGYIYIYWNPGNFGRSKIGYTKNIKQRLIDWEKQCDKTLYLLFPQEAEQGAPVQHIARVEKLVHAELKDYRRQEVRCLKCNQRHMEWFEVDNDLAVNVVKKWTSWMLREPYIQKVCDGESQWVLGDEARKSLGDICRAHGKLPG